MKYRCPKMDPSIYKAQCVREEGHGGWHRAMLYSGESLPPRRAAARRRLPSEGAEAVSVPDFGPKGREAAEQRMLDYAGRKLSRLGMRLHDPQFKLSYSSTGLAFLNLTAIALNRDYCRLDRFILSDGAWIED